MPLKKTFDSSDFRYMIRIQAKLSLPTAFFLEKFKTKESELDKLFHRQSFFTSGKKTFDAFIIVYRSKKGEPETEINIECLIRESKKKPGSSQKPPHMIELNVFEFFDKCSKIFTADVDVNFTYPTKTHQSAVPLPYPTSIPPFENAKISGLRINFQDALGQEFSIIVDLKKETLHHSVGFQIANGNLKASSLSELIERAGSYSKTLISQPPKPHAKTS